FGDRPAENPLSTHARNSCANVALSGADTENARYTEATTPIIDCQKNFERADRPFGFFATTLRQSSTQPTAPKPSVTSSTTQTKRLSRSAHKSVVIAIETRISAPPIVGVPAFVRCVCGPSLRTDWPMRIRVSQLIIRGPTRNEITSAVIVASTARSEM